jgi:hypothetical protein
MSIVKGGSVETHHIYDHIYDPAKVEKPD